MRPAWFYKIGVALVAVLALAGCREEELDRPLFFDKGTYLGPEDQSLSEEQLEQLRQRSRLQNTGGL